MTRDRLVAANRALLRAIEVPPESGHERRLDDLAARVWRMARGRDDAPDPGECCRLRQKLAAVEGDLPGRRARYVSRAREQLRAYAERVGRI